MLKNVTKLISYIFVLSLYHGYAQEFYISGNITAEDHEPLVYANVFLLSSTDSTMVKAVSSDAKGAFVLEKLEKGNYILKSSYVGYKEHFYDLSLDGSKKGINLVLVKIIEELEGVVVNRPTIERKADRLTFNVANTSLSNVSSLDIIRQTPGVIVNNGSILVKNTSASVYINDREVYLSGEELSRLLANYSGSNIQSVEVITNPSAKYNAEAGTVINIITSKSISIGYKGSIEGRWTQAVFPKYALGTSHYYKGNTVDAFLNYSYNPGKEYKHDDSYVNWFDGDNPDGSWESDFKKITHSYAHQVNVILDFKLNKKSHLNLSSHIWYAPNTTLENKMRTRVLDVNKNLDSYFLTNSDINNDKSNMSFTGDYELKIGQNGTKMDLVSEYIYYQNDQDQYLETNYFNPDDSHSNMRSFDFTAKQKNNIFTQGVDFSIPIKEALIETGAKYNSHNSNSYVIYAGNVVPLNVVDDHFKYKESVYAGYAQYSNDWDKWSLSTGVRGEYTDVEANSIALGEINTRKYFELFPTANVSYSPSENHQYSVMYKRSLERPKYSSLNPYRYYSNENQYISGNPRLTRAIDNKIAFDYTYKGKYIFSLYYQNINNNLSRLIFQDNENRTSLESIYNIEQEFQYSLDFTYYGYITDWWYLYTYMSGFYIENEFTAIQSGHTMQRNHTWGYLGQAYNQLSLSDDGTLNTNFTLYYLSNFISGSYKMKNQFYIDLGVTKTLWDKRADISLNITDLFNTNKMWLRSRYLNQDNGFIARQENRSISLGFKYKFGNFRLSDNNRETRSQEQDRLEEKSVL
ncbi:TonB-dependent receptor [Zhouia spongiae]|uniref:TonB-dependent receptor n=1 Tax=Zhouia spongiae TaxID=2202721 RepID=A0ABY3YPQ1_9FLAO|nr:outer membrane beta-barrel protein [Zhouia spongiae]UNY99754.1 TonB-dependent receptor [Zhouia spongiae]